MNMCFITSSFPRPAHRLCMVSGLLHMTSFPAAALQPWMVPEDSGDFCHDTQQPFPSTSVLPEITHYDATFLRSSIVHLSSNTESLVLNFYPKCHSLPFL